MTNQLRLHYAPDNASLCIRLAMEELELSYETVLVERKYRQQRSEAYLALNPNGLIPVLETPKGPIFETGAILLWLSEEYDGLLPPVGADDRAQALQWLMWLANTLHPALRMIFYPDHYAASTETTERTRARIGEMLDILETAKTVQWLDADAASAQACYLAPMLRWLALYGEEPGWFSVTSWPRLHAFAARMERRTASVACAKLEGLGLTPFSNPSPVNPPEGSAV